MAAERERLNRYTCSACKGSVVTVDIDEGTTPFMLACRATPRCNGVMQSSLYRGVSGVPTFAWRKPTQDEYRAATAAGRHHYDLGGLDIHPFVRGIT